MTVLAHIPVKLKIEMAGEEMELAELQLPVEGRVHSPLYGVTEVRITSPTYILDGVADVVAEYLRKHPCTGAQGVSGE